MPESIKPKRLYEIIVEHIIHQIDTGQLQSGDILPSERQLAHNMGVSKTAVREALSALESMGYTKTKKGEGTFVAPMTLESLILPLSIVLSQDSNMIKNILELRLIIEPRIAALATQRISDDQIGALKDISADMLCEINKGGLACKEDNQFHTLLARATGNSVLARLYEMCQSVLIDTTEIIAQWPGQPKKGYLKHLEILDAVNNRDSERAAALMREHVSCLFAIYAKSTAGIREAAVVSAN
jgi:GntR family transcriptional repressor for pyruvate dehydrogenase complex